MGSNLPAYVSAYSSAKKVLKTNQNLGGIRRNRAGSYFKSASHPLLCEAGPPSAFIPIFSLLKTAI